MAKRLFTLIPIFLFGVLFLMAGSISGAYAAWKPQYANVPEYIQEWYRTQHDKSGNYCCDRADGHDYYDGYDMNADGSVTLRSGLKIPAYKVLTGPNPTGHAVWWHDSYTTYCFSPGSMY